MTQVGAQRTSEELGAKDPRWRRGFQAFFAERFKKPLRVASDGRVEVKKVKPVPVPAKLVTANSKQEKKLNQLIEWAQRTQAELTRSGLMED